jgi:ATP-dependent Clp protease ATP-binding subunit ClpA
MFERFTNRARRVVVLAQEEARLLRHDYIGTEHILLGLLAEGSGVGYQALTAEGISLEAVRGQVEQIIGQGDSTPSGHIPFTPRAKKVLELSLREALQLGHNYIGTEHILLGLIREGEGVACQAMVALGANLPAMTARVHTMVGGGGAMAPPRPGIPRRMWASLTRSGRASTASGPLIYGPEPVYGSPPVGQPVLRRLTAGAWRAVLFGQVESLRHGQPQAGEEHLLFGILAEAEGNGAKALNAVGVTLEQAREQADAILGTSATEPSPPLEPSLAATGLEVMELALVEAVSAGRHGIDTDDLLLGFVRRAEQGDGGAADTLSVLGTSADAVRQAVDELRAA